MLMKIKESEKKEKIKSPECTAQILRSILSYESEIDQDKEHFWCLGLKTNNTIKYVELVSLGSLNEAIVAPREVFRLAISQGVNSIVVGHNHPSGDTKPSNVDIHLTNKIKKAGDIIGIKLLDHVIIGEGSKSFSFLETNIL